MLTTALQSQPSPLTLLEPEQDEKEMTSQDVQSTPISGCDSTQTTLQGDESYQEMPSKTYNGLAVVIDSTKPHPMNRVSEVYVATPNSNGEPSQPQATSGSSNSSVDMTDIAPHSPVDMPFVDIPKRKGSRGVLDTASPMPHTADSKKSDVSFSKRTSSLPASVHPETLKFGQSSQQPPTTAFDTVATLTSSWAGLLAGMGFGKKLKDTDSSLDVQSQKENFAGNRDSVASMLQYISQQDRILEQLDDTSTKLTLARLERENQLLELNPKTILADSGSYRTTTTTLQDLKSATSVVETESDSEFWNSLMTDYASLVQKIPHLLNNKIRAGIPYHLRPKIWMVMCNAQTDRIALLYPSLVREESPFERIILRDLPRTFPKVDFFKEADGPGQKMLYNVLKAYSIYDSEVGYCQGLSFIVGPLLMQNLSEVETFSILVRLMEESPVKYTSLPRKESGGVCLTPRYNLRSMFTPHMKGLHLMIYQHTQLLSKILPPLYQHFQTHQIHATMYASQWFLTMFAYNFPFPMVFRIFDILLAEGADETILRFSIALLKKSEEKLLEQDEFEGILKYLKEDTIFMSYQGNVEDLVQDAMSLTHVINEANLESYKKEFEKQNLTAEEELQTMRNLVQQLRNDSSKMVETLRDLSLRNAILERDHASFQVFKKGAQLETESLRKELEQSKLLIDLLKTDKQLLTRELGSIQESSIKQESKTVEEMEELRIKIKDLEYMVEHLVGLAA